MKRKRRIPLDGSGAEESQVFVLTYSVRQKSKFGHPRPIKGHPIDMASTEVVDTKVMGMLVLVAILFKVNQVGRQQVGILQALEMIIGGDRGITTTIRIVIIEQAMGVISRGGIIRTMVEGEVLFSHASGVLMKVWFLDQLMRNCSIRRFRQ